MHGGQNGTTTLHTNNGGGMPQHNPLSGINELVGGAPTHAPQNAQHNPFPASPSGPPSSAPALPSDNFASSGQSGNAGPGVGSNGLLDLKQQALQQLTPLVGHLEQTPLEKFRTTMMLIQASDNQSLLKDAYDAANAIQDDKTRAQALLDVVNEINYFTQAKDQ